MAAQQVDTSWMWHPDYDEAKADSAGLFLHFRKCFKLDVLPPGAARIHLTADTRYKLYINARLVCSGPVKGDKDLWFFDEIDIAPYLRVGNNRISIHVLRYFYGTRFAPSFPRLPYGGVMIRSADPAALDAAILDSSGFWETAIDENALLRIDQPEDDFLHIYEHHHSTSGMRLCWVPAYIHAFQISTGLSPPWKLHKRMIPPLDYNRSSFSGVHNVKSIVPESVWKAAAKSSEPSLLKPWSVVLPAGTSHYFELEVENHMTAFIQFRFKRPRSGGTTLAVTYAESYEEPPRLVPYLRSKAHRRDFSKALYGPQDHYTFHGRNSFPKLGYYEEEDESEIFAPFHFRTFRFMTVRIEVNDADLILDGIDLTRVNYPLEIVAKFETVGANDDATLSRLWTTSIRTLNNCMHDCYEDCPFYEQLQYAMDTRNSALFTYYVSGDDRLARQAIIQMHNSFQPRIGLTSSRAPSHAPQFIPHFSLFWIAMLEDHLSFFNDKEFLRPFVSTIDGVLHFFHQDIDDALGLVKVRNVGGIWNFVDWTDQWRPYGIPPAADRTGFSTYTNCLYAYVLRLASKLLQPLGRSSLAIEYVSRSKAVVDAIRTHCFDGSFFTDGLVKDAVREIDYSQHNQFWAVLCGAIDGDDARELLEKTINSSEATSFVLPSTAMSFFALRAISKVGGSLYDDEFEKFWEPWRNQLALGMTTWEEDSVSQRSDCHAWGSVPIYEFMAEVVGLTPATAGWSTLRFQPRLSLLPSLKAAIPIGICNKGTKRVALVCWNTNNDDVVNVSLKLELGGDKNIAVEVILPGGSISLLNVAAELTFRVNRLTENRD